MVLVAYVKRYCMERPILARPPAVAPPLGYHLVPWSEALLDAHADVLFRAFAHDLDGKVFPNLARPDTCRGVMVAIRGLSDFLPSACWLMAGPNGYAGAVQGVMNGTAGLVQNLGVCPEDRGKGVAAALLARCLRAFANAGATWCHLEVTADNEPAVRLYKRWGFRPTRVRYKPTDGGHFPTA